MYFKRVIAINNEENDALQLSLVGRSSRKQSPANNIEHAQKTLPSNNDESTSEPSVQRATAGALTNSTTTQNTLKAIIQDSVTTDLDSGQALDNPATDSQPEAPDPPPPQQAYVAPAVNPITVCL